MRKRYFLLALFLLLALLAGCMRTDGEAPEQADAVKPELPSDLRVDEVGSPIL